MVYSNNLTYSAAPNRAKDNSGKLQTFVKLFFIFAVVAGVVALYRRSYSQEHAGIGSGRGDDELAGFEKMRVDGSESDEDTVEAAVESEEFKEESVSDENKTIIKAGVTENSEESADVDVDDNSAATQQNVAESDETAEKTVQDGVEAASESTGDQSESKKSEKEPLLPEAKAPAQEVVIPDDSQDADPVSGVNPKFLISQTGSVSSK